MKDFILGRKRKLSVHLSGFVARFDIRQVYQEEIYVSCPKRKKAKNGKQLTRVRNGKRTL